MLDGSLLLTADCSYRLGIYFYSHVGQTKVNQTLFPVLVHFTPCFHSLSHKLFTLIDFS